MTSKYNIQIWFTFPLYWMPFLVMTYIW